jgi:5-methylcytosine-specific restriction endonuclease McrA
VTALPLSAMTEDYDPTRFSLGRLCPFGHAWGSTRKSLRRIKGGQCIECQREARASRRWLSSKAGRQSVEARFRLFGNRCVYCQAAAPLEADHFFPLVVVGGNDTGNIVPACRRCNSSKQNTPPERWFRSQPFFSEDRLRWILRKLGLKDTKTIQRCLF